MAKAEFGRGEMVDIENNITEEELADHFERVNARLDIEDPPEELDISLINFQNLVWYIFHG